MVHVEAIGHAPSYINHLTPSVSSLTWLTLAEITNYSIVAFENYISMLNFTYIYFRAYTYLNPQINYLKKIIWAFNNK